VTARLASHKQKLVPEIPSSMKLRRSIKSNVAAAVSVVVGGGAATVALASVETVLQARLVNIEVSSIADTLSPIYR